VTQLSDRLAALGLTLPAANAPLASYVPARRAGDLLFLSGHVPRNGGGVVAGVVGGGVDLATARDLARAVALDLLASGAASLGSVDSIAGVVRITGFVRSAPGFGGQPTVINGASDLFVDVLGERGRHARSAVGVSELPLGAVLEIEAIFEIAG
jgi:enamine deaminase RidA (YjgF/YER057c/UK114 family)